MKQIKITTKWITIEVFRRGLVFSVASILLATGATLCNENVIIALISIVNKQLFLEDSNSYGLFVGLFLILVSLFLYYLLIINWRKEIYNEIFIYIRKAVDSFGTTWRVRNRFASTKDLKPLQIEAQSDYERALSFLKDNQPLIDSETYDKAWTLLNKVALGIEELSYYITYLEDIENGNRGDWDPNLANKSTVHEIHELAKLHKEFISLIKEKERYRITG